MDILQNAIAEYEECLIGNRRTISNYYFSYNQYGNMKLALQVIKHGLEKYLRWNPEQLRDCLTPEIMEQLRLQQMVRHIIFPPELDASRDLFFIIWQLYPHTIHFSDKDLILRVYKGILDRTILKYPKEFFTGHDGRIRSQVCLRYMIEQFLPINSLEELYEYFASSNCQNVLKQNKLLVICNDLYETPLEYLHKSLPKGQQNEFLFRFNDFTLRRSNQKFQVETSKKREVKAKKKAGDSV